MRIKIAELRLAPGQVGFYDELTNIHLTLTSPFASVYQGMNTSRLQQSVNSGRLILVSGSLKPAPVRAAEEVVVETKTVKAAETKVQQAKVVEEEAKVEEIKVEETVATLSLEAEEVTEETKVVEEEEVEAPKTKKRTSKKKEVEE